MINLEGGWKITSDGSNFILQKLVGVYPDKKSGKPVERYDNFKYYSNLSQAVQGYLKMEECKYITDNDLTLREALIGLQEQNKRIQEMLKEILSETK